MVLEQIISNSRPFYARSKFWEHFGMTKRPSTGFYFISVALALCTDVHLYGFSPFDRGLDGWKPVSYHYYDNLNITVAHDMVYEFKTMVSMHQLGLLHLHVDKCTNT